MALALRGCGRIVNTTGRWLEIYTPTAFMRALMACSLIDVIASFRLLETVYGSYPSFILIPSQLLHHDSKEFVFLSHRRIFQRSN